MTTIAAAASQTFNLTAAQVLQVSTADLAYVDLVAGAPGSPYDKRRVNAGVPQSFGPYGVAATITVRAVQGAAQVDDVTPVSPLTPAEIAAFRAGGGGGGGATTFAALTDKATVDLPSVNGPLATALAAKAPASAIARTALDNGTQASLSAADAALQVGPSNLYILGLNVLGIYGDAGTSNVSGTMHRVRTLPRDVTCVAAYIPSYPAADRTHGGDFAIGGDTVRAVSLEPTVGAKPLPLTAAGRRKFGVPVDGAPVVTDPLALPIAKATTIRTKDYGRSIKPPTPTLVAGTGGSLAAATYYVKIAARCAGAESYLSAEVSTAVSATGTLQVNWSGQHRDDEQVAIYVSTATGVEKLLCAVPAYLGTYTITALTGQGIETGNTLTASSVPISYAGGLVSTEGYNRVGNGGDGGDYTNITTASLPTGQNGNGAGGPPHCLLGDYPAGSTDSCSLFLGDSIPVGVGTPGGAGIYAQGWGGWPCRAFLSRAPKDSACVYAIGSMQLQYLVDGSAYTAGRLGLLSYAKVVYCQLGINDNGAGRTWSQWAANHLTLAKRCRPGTKYRPVTLTPAIVSGDYGLALPSYTAATGAATQVQRGQEADRKLCNSWIRNGCQVDGSGNPVQSGGTSSPYIDAANFFDAASFVEVNASNVLTLNGGYWMVPTTQDQTGLVVSSATYDGSVSGNNATSGAAGTITITTAPWTAGNLSQPGQGGKVIRMTGGSQAGKVAVISLNSTNVIALYSPTLSGYTGAPGAPVNPFTAAPAPGDTFEIWKVVSADGIHPPEYGQGLIATGFAAHLAALYG